MKEIELRISRALNEPMFLIDWKETDKNEKIFTIAEKNGEVSQTALCQLPECNCCDYENGNLCKHLVRLDLT